MYSAVTPRPIICGSSIYGDYRATNTKGMNKMACIDFLIWIGKPRAHGIGVYETIDGYIKESKNMGCCRRIPQVPSWAVLGQSRVFLVHQGNHKRLDRGSVFGYYTLERIEFSEELKRCQSIALPGLGRLVLSERKERHGINPRTREAILIPARKVVKFRPTKRIKDEMNPKNKV